MFLPKSVHDTCCRILRHINDKCDPETAWFSRDVVEHSIHEHAGYSDTTIRRYMKYLVGDMKFLKLIGRDRFGMTRAGGRAAGLVKDKPAVEEKLPGDVPIKDLCDTPQTATAGDDW